MLRLDTALLISHEILPGSRRVSHLSSFRWRTTVHSVGGSLSIGREKQVLALLLISIHIATVRDDPRFHELLVDTPSARRGAAAFLGFLCTCE